MRAVINHITIEEGIRADASEFVPSYSENEARLHIAEVAPAGWTINSFDLYAPIANLTRFRIAAAALSGDLDEIRRLVGGGDQS